jgi:hypothetical protein
MCLVLEVKAFLGLNVNMGLIPLSNTKDYWSHERKMHKNYVGHVMSRDHFLQIFWMNVWK